VSRGRSVLTLEQYKELLRLSAEAKAAGKNMESWKIAYEWGVNVGTLKSARRRGIKHYDVMIRKEQQQKAREAEQQRRLYEVNAEALILLKAVQSTRYLHFISEAGPGMRNWDNRVVALIKKAGSKV
jgi:tRNA(His) 5'-end guanylyltransferase